MQKILKNEAETIEFGKQLGMILNPTDIICLVGDLGAGKTCLSKSIAKSYGISEDITSPTFNIVNEYEENQKKLFHFDVYRLSDAEELYYIGFENYISGDGLCIIEWADIVREVIPKDAIWVYINYSQDFSYRIAKLDCMDEEKLKRIKNQIKDF